MEQRFTDMRKELENRMNIIRKEIDRLKEGRAAIDEKVKDTESKLDTLRRFYEIEAERLGEPNLPPFGKGGKSYRFAGMRVGEALKLLRREQPEITKEKAYKTLEKEGFDFGGKRPRSSVHFAWIALERSKKKQ